MIKDLFDDHLYCLFLTSCHLVSDSFSASFHSLQIVLMPRRTWKSPRYPGTMLFFLGRPQNTMVVLRLVATLSRNVMLPRPTGPRLEPLELGISASKWRSYLRAVTTCSEWQRRTRLDCRTMRSWQKPSKHACHLVSQFWFSFLDVSLDVYRREGWLGAWKTKIFLWLAIILIVLIAPVINIPYPT